MRILGIGDSLDLGDLYLRLAAEGHAVRVFVEDRRFAQVMDGMVERVADWRDELPWIRAAGAQGLIIFETAAHGVVQDQLRLAGYHVIGGSAFGDRLESDRAFGQQVLRGSGLRTAPVWSFTTHRAALDFLARHPGRYVYKPNGARQASDSTCIGECADGSDLRALLELLHDRQPPGTAADFVLMQHVEGVETGVGAYFNGNEFLTPACLDWEHKRFFTGDLGELTGEMGTLVTYRGAERLLTETLLPLTPLLRASGYHGYLNLNTIINQDGVWPLEFTSRFGYPGYAILDALHPHGWEDLLQAMADGQGRRGFATVDGYAVGVVLTIPPFPQPIHDPLQAVGLPVEVRGGMDVQALRHLHLAEVARRDGRLVTSGPTGYVLVATGVGRQVASAQQAAYGLLSRVIVPGARWRTDIGDRHRLGDGLRLQRWGYGPPSGRPLDVVRG
jgi:phosphoribosylamine--glycine ligase